MTTRILISAARGGDAERDLFDGYTVLAAPLPGYSAAEREARVFRRASGNGTDYGSHTLALATPSHAQEFEGGRPLYLLVQHGAGRQVLALPSFYDGGDYERALIAMPEKLLYAALYTLYRVATEADSVAREETRDKWAKAVLEKRTRIKRKNGRRRVWIYDPDKGPEDIQKAIA